MGKTYRPPQAVCEESSLGGKPMTLSEVHLLYSELVKKSTINDSLRWSRRILRQEAALSPLTKAHRLLLPELVDLHLGPVILASLVNDSCDKAADAVVNAQLSGACVPAGDRTLVFVSCGEEAVGKELTDPDFVEFEFDKAIIVDDNPARMRSLAKLEHEVPLTAFEAAHHLEIGLEVVDDWVLKADDEGSAKATIIKVDEELGLVFGWAIISTIKKEDYFDKQGDHIPDESMLEAATDFMLTSRKGGEMHLKNEDGTKLVKGVIAFAWPMTAEIAKAFEIVTDVTGLMIAYKPDDGEILEKFKDGTYTGFSIGGFRGIDEEVGNGAE